MNTQNAEAPLRPDEPRPHDHRYVADQVRVHDLMTAPAVAVLDTDTVWTAMERFVVAGTWHLVVVTDDGRCAGVLSAHHVAAVWPMDAIGQRHYLVRDLLDPLQEAPAVLVSTTAADAARVMVRLETDALMVIDADGAVVGIITGGDLVRLVAMAGS